MKKLTRRSFLASVAATAVAVTMPAALSHIPKGRWVRCVQTLPGGYIGSVHIYTAALSDADLMNLSSFMPPGGIPTIDVGEDNPVVNFSMDNGVFNCKIKHAPDSGWTILKAQVEKGAYPTSYIPTINEPVTRPATSCTVSREDMDRCGGVLDFETIPFTGGAYRDYDQDGKFLGVLVEESRENLCIHSLTLEKE